jgi:hypothetical protein
MFLRRGWETSHLNRGSFLGMTEAQSEDDNRSMIKNLFA